MTVLGAVLSFIVDSRELLNVQGKIKRFQRTFNYKTNSTNVTAWAGPHAEQIVHKGNVVPIHVMKGAEVQLGHF